MEKISEIILGFDPSNFLRQVEYCRLRNFEKKALVPIGQKCKNTDRKTTVLEPIFLHKNNNFF